MEAGGAAGGVLLLFLIWLAAFHVGLLERADRAVFLGFAGLERPRVNRIASAVVGLCNPKPYLFLCTVVVLVALVRRRLSMAVAIAAILLGANETTQLLKQLLAEPRSAVATDGVMWVVTASWPSGHATAAMSLALSAVLAAPPSLRPLLAGAGGVFAVAVGYSLVTLAEHFPSDVLGGYLVAGTWSMAALAAVFALRERLPRAPVADATAQLTVREALRPPVAALVIALGLALVLALARPHYVISYARADEAFVVGAGAIAALGLTVATGVMLTLRR
jgi:membrane-associated phospholipid phosphatase